MGPFFDTGFYISGFQRLNVLRMEAICEQGNIRFLNFKDSTNLLHRSSSNLAIESVQPTTLFLEAIMPEFIQTLPILYLQLADNKKDIKYD